VFDTEAAASERMERRAVAAAVVGEQPLDLDPVSSVESDGAVEKPTIVLAFSSCKFAIASTRSGAVRLATRRGAEERSRRPSSPSSR
jgi:hypothetical protein